MGSILNQNLFNVDNLFTKSTPVDKNIWVGTKMCKISHWICIFCHFFATVILPATMCCCPKQTSHDYSGWVTIHDLLHIQNTGAKFITIPWYSFNISVVSQKIILWHQCLNVNVHQAQKTFYTFTYIFYYFNPFFYRNFSRLLYWSTELLIFCATSERISAC